MGSSNMVIGSQSKRGLKRPAGAVSEVEGQTKKSKLAPNSQECRDEFEEESDQESLYEQLAFEEMFSMSDGIMFCQKCTKKYKRGKLAVTHAKGIHRVIVKKPVKEPIKK